MVMDKNEIVYRWEHGAKSPMEMVKILSQLNDCTEKEIVTILFYARKLSGQGIFQYRKSGKLDCTDEEAAEFAKGKENEKTGKNGTADSLPGTQCSPLRKKAGKEDSAKQRTVPCLDINKTRY
ncbi:MAG: hypothetical protein MJ177_06195 [Clostridia bacterium]|nr:hypothetical protein [Clostridia bacterium]